MVFRKPTSPQWNLCWLIHLEMLPLLAQWKTGWSPSRHTFKDIQYLTMMQKHNGLAANPKCTLWSMISSINEGLMVFYLNASHKPRALHCSTTSMAEFVVITLLTRL